MIIRHHLLECILWPNGDGTFRKIVNTQKRLKELGIYDDYKMTIQIDQSSHIAMHHRFKDGTEYRIDGEKSPLYGKFGTESNAWKGENCSIPAKYRRARLMYNAGDMTKEEFQIYKNKYSEYMRDYRQKSRNNRQ